MSTVYMVCMDGRGEPVHLASTPEKALAFCRVYLAVDDDDTALVVNPMVLDTNIDDDHADYMGKADLDEHETTCGDCFYDFIRKDMVELVVSIPDTEWFCKACAAKRSFNVTTHLYDGMGAGIMTQDDTCECGCVDTIVLKHMSKVLSMCADCWHRRLRKISSGDRTRRIVETMR